jgi:hypothetical protein
MKKEKLKKISPLFLLLAFLAGSFTLASPPCQENPGQAEGKNKVEGLQQQVQAETGQEAPGEEGGVAIIDFDHREFDFGRQLAEQNLEHTFKVYNKGTVPLRITSIRTG